MGAQADGTPARDQANLTAGGDKRQDPRGGFRDCMRDSVQASRVRNT